MADLEHVDKQHAQRQRQQGSDNEPAQGADADTADRTAVLHAGNAGYQCAEHQRRDDHLDQPQEHISDDGEIRGDFLRSRFVRRQVVADVAGHDAQHHADQNPSRCLHFLHLRILPYLAVNHTKNTLKPLRAWQRICRPVPPVQLCCFGVTCEKEEIAQRKSQGRFYEMTIFCSQNKSPHGGGLGKPGAIASLKLPLPPRQS